jgi:hypothetical protein
MLEIRYTLQFSPLLAPIDTPQRRPETHVETGRIAHRADGQASERKRRFLGSGVLGVGDDYPIVHVLVHRQYR